MQVFGAILGKQSGRHVEMMNSFEVKWSDEGKGYAVIDTGFLSTREQQCKAFFLMHYSRSYRIFNPFHSILMRI